MMSRAYVLLLSSCLVLLQLCAAGLHSHSPRHLRSGPRQPQPLSQCTDTVLLHHLELILDLSYTNDDPVCPSEGLSENLLDVEYRYGTSSTAGAPWRRLKEVPENTTDDVSIPFDMSRKVDLVQFRFIQREHGGGRCNCWNINATLITPTLNISLEDCDSSGTDPREAGFCGGSASVLRGYVTTPISISSGEAVETNDTSCMLIDKKTVIRNCGDKQDYIELRFNVNYVNEDCNPPDSVDEGIELAIRSSEKPEWVPLAFYAAHNNSSPVFTIDASFTPQSTTINIRGYPVPLIRNFQSNTEQVVQNAGHKPNFTRDSLFLENITLAMINDQRSCLPELQLFDNTADPYLESLRWVEVTTDKCVQQESNVLLFGAGVPQIAVFSSRIVKTVEIPLRCFPSASTSLSAEFDRIQTLISSVPALFEIQQLSFSDPCGTLTMLHNVFRDCEDEIETAVVVVLLSEILDAASNLYDNMTPEEQEDFVEMFLTISSDLLSSASDPKSQPDESEGVAGSSLLILMDDFALGPFRFTLKDISDTDSYENIAFMVQEVPQTRNGSVEGIVGDDYSIIIPPEAFNRAPVNVASYYYRNMSNLLPANLSNITVVANGSLTLISPVVSSALQCGDQDCGTNNLTKPVIIEFPHPKVEPGDEVYCVFWNFLSRAGPLAEGEWSTEGCERDNESSSDDETVCLCYHLTHFGVLLSPTGSQLPEDVTLSLQVIGYIGVTVSLVCLVLTAVTFLVLRSLWNMRNYIHINLCISLIIAQLIFVIGIDKTGNRVGCQVVAVLLHYFFLVSFMWMLMEGVVLYVSLVRVFVKHKKRYIAAFTIASYSLPLLYMVLCIPLGFLLWEDGIAGYGYEEACWLRYDVHFIWAFIIPVILIIICNVGFFIMALTIMYRHQKRQEHASRVATAKHRLKVAISLVLVMGLTWIIGVVQFHEVLQIAVSYLFTIFIGLQGVLIFILFVPLSKQVREAYTKWWRLKVNESDFLSRHFGSNTAMTAVKSASNTDKTRRVYSISDSDTPKLEFGIVKSLIPAAIIPASQDSAVVLQSIVQHKDSDPKMSVSPHDNSTTNGAIVNNNVEHCEEPAEMSSKHL